MVDEAAQDSAIDENSNGEGEAAEEPTTDEDSDGEPANEVANDWNRRGLHFCFGHLENDGATMSNSPTLTVPLIKRKLLTGSRHPCAIR